ncbi:helix-turn-helix transcriptional regulator [Streptomyces kaniharaensis]|uniref:Helix-turn-helix transcriptional regulator n=1 Tax=Streptomyces kaniharaensis TaxID=212423 RepID=A0A6N7KX12_9ACTN|nr:metalloregulator ArsR/SmtB family transcription factor [Streptomyces kaniharaensis]MQS15315.1 helix-turn-helix transcriptional regulator [Streptomyces kaniharaensis]
MHRFTLDLADLATTWFAVSPIQEASLSLRMWTHPGVYPLQTRAFERLRPTFERLDSALLLSLVAENRWIPDFLTPRPAAPATDFRTELAAVRGLPPEQLRPELEQTFLPHGRPLPAPLAAGLADPARLLGRIADALEEYWEVCLAPTWWPQARAVLDADLVYRARLLAQHGAAALFADLDHRLRWENGVLSINRRWTDWDGETAVDGRGLVLTPTFFARGAITMISNDRPPHICYPARGQAGMTGASAPVPPQALEALLGAPKARLLALLAEPASTTDLAYRLGVTPSAVSQHLSVLAATGLVTRARHGRSVLYRRSPLGDELTGANR